jgi:hypothetical protein
MMIIMQMHEILKVVRTGPYYHPLVSRVPPQHRVGIVSEFLNTMYLLLNHQPMKGKMKMDTFTVNRAAQLLERDRRTLIKALRNTPPDAKVRGQSQWRLKTIIDAASRLPHAIKTASRSNSHDSDDDWAAREFDSMMAFTRASDAVIAIGKMPKRLRKAEAKHVFAKIDALMKLYEKYEPDGLSEHPLSVVQALMGGLMHELDIELDPSEFPDADGD